MRSVSFLRGTRAYVALEVGGHFRCQDVASILTRVSLTRGLPATINVDDGTEFTSRAFDHWAYMSNVQLDFSRPGKPTNNATTESSNATVRRECCIATPLFDSRRRPSRAAGVLGRLQQPPTAQQLRPANHGAVSRRTWTQHGPRRGL